MEFFKKSARWAWDNLQTVALVGGWAMSFALPAWATKATQIFSDAAPASWVIAGFLGMFVAAMTYAAFSRARLWLATAKSREVYNQKADRPNPLEDTFRNQRILVSDLLPPFEPVIRNKTFIDCEILGPANILLLGDGTFNGVNFIDCEAIRVRAGSQTRTAIAFDNCHFMRGKLYRFAIFIPHTQYEEAKAGMAGLPWLTPDPQT